MRKLLPESGRNPEAKKGITVVVPDILANAGGSDRQLLRMGREPPALPLGPSRDPQQARKKDDRAFESVWAEATMRKVSLRTAAIRPRREPVRETA